MLGLLNLHAWSRASRNLIVKRNSKDRMPTLSQDNNNNNNKANKAKQNEPNKAKQKEPNKAKQSDRKDTRRHFVSIC